jgi:hypothetical protein
VYGFCWHGRVTFQTYFFWDEFDEIEHADVLVFQFSRRVYSCPRRQHGHKNNTLFHPKERPAEILDGRCGRIRQTELTLQHQVVTYFVLKKKPERTSYASDEALRNPVRQWPQRGENNLYRVGIRALFKRWKPVDTD